jgi:GntR family transcriptional regulator/MocR family aminotransferase
VLLDVRGDAQDVVERAARQGLELTPLDRFRFTSDPTARQALVVGYGTPPDHSYSGALDLLCQVLSV